MKKIFLFLLSLMLLWSPLEAFIHASKGMNFLQHTWLRDTTIHEFSKNQVYAANQL